MEEAPKALEKAVCSSRFEEFAFKMDGFLLFRLIGNVLIAKVMSGALSVFLGCLSWNWMMLTLPYGFINRNSVEGRRFGRYQGRSKIHS